MAEALPRVGTHERLSTLDVADVLDGTELVPMIQDGTTRTAAVATIRRAGAGTSRPAMTAPDAGTSFFDLALGRPVWWTGTAWVDATGAAV